MHEYLEELSRCQSRKFLKNVKVQPEQPILLLLLIWYGRTDESACRRSHTIAAFPALSIFGAGASAFGARSVRGIVARDVPQGEGRVVERKEGG